MKRILIDARLYGPKHTGIGRYTKNLLLALADLPDFSNYQFSVLVAELHPELKKYHQIVTNIRHYSWQEQIFLPSMIYNLQPHLVHFTHFNKPIFYHGSSVITIHDLIKHFFTGQATTTKSPLLYWPKQWLYLLITKINIKNNYLITPSNFWRRYILDTYRIKPEKIITTYEAVDPKLLAGVRETRPHTKNYILYTGNLYPHKNLQVVIEALQYLPQIKLKIICSRDYFLEKFKQKHHDNPQIEFLGFVPDEKFKEIYSQALCLVHPSLMEGFSLTGLEAMALNCPVIASNASCLPEIYSDSVLYFDPHNPLDLAQKIKLLTPEYRQQLIKKGHQQVKKYSWQKTARQTLDFYKKILDQ